MENIVAARRLRKSYLKDIDQIDYDAFEKKHSRNIDSVLDMGSINIQRAKISKNEDTEHTKPIFHIGFKTKLIVKSLICSIVLFSYILINLVFLEEAKANKYISAIIYEYSKEGSKSKSLEKMEEISKKAYNSLTFLIPEGVATFVQNNYVNSIKPRIINFNVKEKIKNVFSNTGEKDKTPNDENETSQNNQEVKQNEENSTSKGGESEEGIGGGGPVDTNTVVTEEAKYEESTSAISTQQNDASVFMSKNISCISPVGGTITSTYGARDEIFDDVDPYHTGIDIANKEGTEIKSATQGKVVNVEENNKYYGKMVEIETNSVIFKYGHMSQINVKEGDSVSQGQIVGLMGSTGLSTGNHLHFEIRVSDRSVDPQLLGFYK